MLIEILLRGEKELAWIQGFRYSTPGSIFTHQNQDNSTWSIEGSRFSCTKKTHVNHQRDVRRKTGSGNSWRSGWPLPQQAVSCQKEAGWQVSPHSGMLWPQCSVNSRCLYSFQRRQLYHGSDRPSAPNAVTRRRNKLCRTILSCHGTRCAHKHFKQRRQLPGWYRGQRPPHML